ncbi:MAG: hypothetical protein JWN16_846 [Alphaproteobacteria bacterium]|nr:hypothetical protein [Alphaproteobacteria bacterium]
MTELLRSPFAVWVCLLILVAWIFTLLAVFWPGLGNTKADMRKKDDGNACL